MNQIDTLSGSLYDMIPEAVLRTYHTIAKWTNRTVALLSLIPEHLQKHPQQAFTLFFVANCVFVYGTMKFALMLDERVAAAPKTFEGDEYRFNQFLIDGVVVGTSMIILNSALSRLLQYPLDKVIVATLVTATIALKMFYSALFPVEE